ncbi:MAG: hypothetical protein CVU71_05645 [Deltaproteobacteria bacterium HGW-Deltaproteobacteria-6]|jgi:hypothetical protein|nr:MAG: hypothetical protein CVU71_05645 [Deltaproteobacteria bacterium HGW-Deltaproteobacteria-6]
MEQKQIARQMMEFNKTAFDNSFSAMSALQDQTEKLVFSFLDKAPWFPQEGKKAVNDWVTSYKKGRQDFKAAADESYQKVAEYFAQAEKQQKTKK